LNLELMLEKKDRLLTERDLCAELYNLWITRLHEHQNNPEKYDTYKKMIEGLEPYTQLLKEEIRELNRQICELEGVSSIAETTHARDCSYKYGFDKPNK